MSDYRERACATCGSLLHYECPPCPFCGLAHRDPPADARTPTPACALALRQALAAERAYHTQQSAGGGVYAVPGATVGRLIDVLKARCQGASGKFDELGDSDPVEDLVAAFDRWQPPVQRLADLEGAVLGIVRQHGPLQVKEPVWRAVAWDPAAVAEASRRLIDRGLLGVDMDWRLFVKPQEPEAAPGGPRALVSLG